MDSRYLIVDKKILPEYFEKVVEASRLLAECEVSDISEAVRTVGISRSTYYKYKDYVMERSARKTSKRAIMSLQLRHEAGVLEKLIRVIASHSYSICTINQSPPVNNIANVMLALNMDDATCGLERLVADMRAAEGIKKANLIGVE